MIEIIIGIVAALFIVVFVGPYYFGYREGLQSKLEDVQAKIDEHKC